MSLMPIRNPRKTPSQARSIQTVDSILEAAMIAIEKTDGVVLSSTHISESAGVSVGTFYQYFPNKESLYEALLQKVIDKNSRNIIAMLEGVSASNLREKIADLVDFVIERFVGKSFLVKAVLNIALRKSHNDIAMEARMRVIESIARVLEESLGFEKKRSLTKAYVATTSMIGVMLDWSMRKDMKGLKREELREELIETVYQILSA